MIKRLKDWTFFYLGHFGGSVISTQCTVNFGGKSNVNQFSRSANLHRIKYHNHGRSGCVLSYASMAVMFCLMQNRFYDPFLDILQCCKHPGIQTCTSSSDQFSNLLHGLCKMVVCYHNCWLSYTIEACGRRWSTRKLDCSLGMR